MSNEVPDILGQISNEVVQTKEESNKSSESGNQSDKISHTLGEKISEEAIGKGSNFIAAEKAIDASQKLEFPFDFNFKGYDFVLHENVFSPIFFKGSSVYVDHLPLKENDNLLDMGCGCGVIGITALLKYHLNKVVCADINPYAVENTKENVSKHGISDKVKVVQSDVFSNIDSKEKFDLMFWNAPYFDGEFDENNILYRSMYDKNYEHIKKFILEGQKYLKEGGRIMIGFSSDKFPLEYARKLINEIGFDFEVFYQEVDSLGFKQEILNVVKK